MVRAAGLEPAHRMATEPKSVESTNSTTPACLDADTDLLPYTAHTFLSYHGKNGLSIENILEFTEKNL